MYTIHPAWETQWRPVLDYYIIHTSTPESTRHCKSHGQNCVSGVVKKQRTVVCCCWRVYISKNQKTLFPFFEIESFIIRRGARLAVINILYNIIVLTGHRANAVIFTARQDVALPVLIVIWRRLIFPSHYRRP